MLIYINEIVILFGRLIPKLLNASIYYLWTVIRCYHELRTGIKILPHLTN